MCTPREYALRKELCFHGDGCTCSHALAVELKHGPKVLLSVLKSYPVTSTLNQVFTSMYPPENLTILKVEVLEVSERKTGPWLQVEAKEFVQMLVDS